MKTSLPLPLTVSRGARRPRAYVPALPRSRAFWFALGFFTALTLAGYVAGIFHLPA